MNRTKIDWPGLTHTWNPVVGCKKLCEYCYAIKMNNRFKWIPKFEEPRFFSDRLDEPLKMKKPASIFVGSMCDLFGDWVPDDWIRAVLNVCRKAPQHTYWFLTKYPGRYKRIYFPNNCRIGVTITGEDPKEDYYRIEQLLFPPAMFRFVSIEPIKGVIHHDLSFADLVIVGPETPVREQPKREWVNSVKHENIHYKNVKGWNRKWN